MNFKGRIDYFWSHGTISDEAFANITKNCHFDDLGGEACEGALKAVVDPGRQFDYYNIYAPICVGAANGAYYPSGYVRQRFVMFHFMNLVLLKFAVLYN